MPLFRKPSPPNGERTPEQRALEREERERRRATRAGVPYAPSDELDPPDVLSSEPSPPPSAPHPAPSAPQPADPGLAAPPEFEPTPLPTAAEPPWVQEDHDPAGAISAEQPWEETAMHDPAAPAGGEQSAEPMAEPVAVPEAAHVPTPPPVTDPPHAHEPDLPHAHEPDPPLTPAPPAAPPAAHNPHPEPEWFGEPVPEHPPADPLPPAVAAPAVHPPTEASAGTTAEPVPEPAPVVPADELHAPLAEQATVAPARPDAFPGPQDTVEHAALGDEPDELGHKPADRPPATDRPPREAITMPARRGRPAAAGGRIPPPPTRRDALLDRRARRLQRHQGDNFTARSLLRPGRILALLALVVVLALLWLLVSLFQPLKGSGQGQVVVVIPHGSGAHTIGNLLAARGVVASGFFFNLRAAVDGDRGQLHSGVYTFKRDMSYAAAIAELLKPPPPPPVVRVLVAEGDSRSMIARIARDDGLAGDYLAASRHSPLLDPTSYGAPRHTPYLEGFLYPATYDLKAGTDARGLVDAQVTAFKAHFGPAQAPAARALHVTLYDLLIVASMVEREALLSRDRPLVAAVIYNRLRSHIALGIDATIRYALNNWSTPLTVSDLRINSPYNTRTRLGLPPTPIGNPGMASIDAAARPSHVPYLYYVDGSDGCGDLKFSTSFSQFQADAAAYQAALARNGGRVPSCHK